MNNLFKNTQTIHMHTYTQTHIFSISRNVEVISSSRKKIMVDSINVQKAIQEIKPDKGSQK